MEYPGSYFTKPWRRAFLLAFVALFFIISPIIIMYAIGYRYDWGNGLLKKTGGISIDILPAETAVFLDDVKIQEKMPIRLKNITPRKYDLSLSAPNYYNWQKEVEVKDKETVYIKEISLLRQNEAEKISADAPKMMSLSNSGRYLVYALEKNESKEKTKYEMYLYNTGDGQTKSLDVEIVDSLPKILWSMDEDYFAITKEDFPIDEVFVIATDVQKETWKLVAPNKTKITKLIWQKTLGPEIFFSTAKEIFSANVGSQKITSVSQNIYLDWQVENGQIWTLQLDTSTKKYLIIKNTLGFASEFTEFDAGLKNKEQKKIPQILTINSEQILVQIQPGDLLLVDQNKQYPITADHWRISPYGNWWLFWTPWEIITYSTGQDPYLLTRSGEGLREVWPLDRYNTLGLVWNARVEALFPYYSVSHTLIDHTVGNIAVDSVNKIIYFTREINNESGIWKLKY